MGRTGLFVGLDPDAGTVAAAITIARAAVALNIGIAAAEIVAVAADTAVVHNPAVTQEVAQDNHAVELGSFVAAVVGFGN